VHLGGIGERTICRYDAIIDRVSHLVPHYRSYLRAAVLAGAHAVNDPFVATDDAVFGLSLAARIGLSVPRTVLLPQKAYGPGVVPERMLGNLEFPLRWDVIAHRVGFPATLRAASGPRFAPMALAHTGDLLAAFDRTGAFPTMMQARPFRAEARYLAICVGGTCATLARLEGGGLEGGDGASRDAADAAERLSRALGATLAGVELAIAGGQVHVLDVQDAAPSLDPAVLGADGLAAVLDRLAQHLNRATRSPRRGRSAWRQPPEA
jgi:hypothetical protein